MSRTTCCHKCVHEVAANKCDIFPTGGTCITQLGSQECNETVQDGTCGDCHDFKRKTVRKPAPAQFVKPTGMGI